MENFIKNLNNLESFPLIHQHPAEIVIIRFILSSETIIEFLAKSEIVVFELVNLDQGKYFFSEHLSKFIMHSEFPMDFFRSLKLVAS